MKIQSVEAIKTTSLGAKKFEIFIWATFQHHLSVLLTGLPKTKKNPTKIGQYQKVKGVHKKHSFKVIKSTVKTKNSTNRLMIDSERN